VEDKSWPLREDDVFEVLALTSEELLNGVNEILEYSKIEASVESIEILKRNSSSLFVAAFEALLQQRLVGIVRVPRGDADYLHNASIFLSTLRLGVLCVDFSHIHPKDIVDGDEETLKFLCATLLSVMEIFKERDNKSTNEGKLIEPSITAAEKSPKDTTWTALEQKHGIAHTQRREAVRVTQPPQILLKHGGTSPRPPLHTVTLPEPSTEPSSARESQPRRESRSKMRPTSARRYVGKRSKTKRPISARRTHHRKSTRSKQSRPRCRTSKSTHGEWLNQVNAINTMRKSANRNWPKQLKRSKSAIKRAHRRRCTTLLRDVEKSDRKSVKSLLDIDSRMKRNSLIQQVKAASKEEITIAKVHKLCKKMEQQYIQEVQEIFKEKIVKLEAELAERTQAIQKYIRDQDTFLQKELASRKRKTKKQKLASQQRSSEIQDHRLEGMSNLQQVIHRIGKKSSKRKRLRKRRSKRRF